MILKDYIDIQIIQAVINIKSALYNHNFKRTSKNFEGSYTNKIDISMICCLFSYQAISCRLYFTKRFSRDLVKRIFFSNLFTLQMQKASFNIKYQRFLIKEYLRPMKQQERKHPAFTIPFKGYYFYLSQPQIGSVSIKFQDHHKGYTYAVVKVFQQISYKTVIAALQKTQPQIIKAQIIPAQQGYELRIAVKLEYINDFQEVFAFKGEKMGEQRRKQLAKNKDLKEKIDSLKKELIKSLKEYVFSGILSNTQRKMHEIFLDLPYETTLNSISFYFKKLGSNIIKVGYFYFDRLTNSKVSQNLLPDQLYTNGSTEITLMGDRSKFDKALFTIEGEFQQATYVVKVESVVQSKPRNIKQVLFRVIAIGVCIWMFYTYDYYLGSPKSTAEL